MGGGFKGLSFSRSANLILNLASGRVNIGAELSSGARIKPLVMNRLTHLTSHSTERGGERANGSWCWERGSSDSEVSQVTRKRKAKYGPFDSAQPTGLLKKAITT